MESLQNGPVLANRHLPLLDGEFGALFGPDEAYEIPDFGNEATQLTVFGHFRDDHVERTVQLAGLPAGSRGDRPLMVGKQCVQTADLLVRCPLKTFPDRKDIERLGDPQEIQYLFPGDARVKEAFPGKGDNESLRGKLADGLTDQGTAHGDLLGEEVFPNPFPGLDFSMKQFLLDADVGFVMKDRMFHGFFTADSKKRKIRGTRRTGTVQLPCLAICDGVYFIPKMMSK